MHCTHHCHTAHCSTIPHCSHTAHITTQHPPPHKHSATLQSNNLQNTIQHPPPHHHTGTLQSNDLKCTHHHTAQCSSQTIKLHPHRSQMIYTTHNITLVQSHNNILQSKNNIKLLHCNQSNDFHNTTLYYICTQLSVIFDKLW